MSIATTASHSHFDGRPAAEASGDAPVVVPSLVRADASCGAPGRAPGGEGEGSGDVPAVGRPGPVEFMWYLRRSLQGQWLGLARRRLPGSCRAIL